MELNGAEVFVILVFRAVWFLAQASIAFVLWYFVVANALELPKYGYFEVCTTYGLLRLIISPPKLTFEV